MGRVADQSPGYDAGGQLAAGFGARFGKAADALGLRAEAAKSLGIAVSTLQRYVAGEAMPPFDVCAQLCSKTGIRMEWLAFNASPMHAPESYVIPGATAPSQSLIREPAALDSGMHATAVRITEEVLGRYGLRERLDFKQYSELTRLVYNDLVRGAAEDVASSSLDRILAITKNDMGKNRGK
jgi:hypothetical protein